MASVRRLKLRRLTPLFLALVLAAPALGAPKLYLRNGTFEPGATRYLAAPGRGAVPSRYQILQFRGPVTEAWKQAVVQRGAALIEYLPEYAYLVRLKPGAEAALRSLPFVQWVGAYAPEMKVDPALARRRGTLVAVAQLFPGESGAELATAAAAAGLQVRARPGQVLLKGDAELIRSLASQPAIRWLTPVSRLRAFLDRARPVIGIDTAWKDDVGLYGDGQIVAVMDTGLDTGNPRTLVPDLQGKVVAAMGHNAEDDWGDRFGHGTHVAGIIAGSGLLSGSDPELRKYGRSYAGVAPLAKLVIEEIDVQLFPTGDKPADFDANTDVTPFLQHGFENGARIHNNSWGDDDVDFGVYSLHAQQIDQFVHDHPGYTVVFAAGNNGQDGVSQKELLDLIGDLGIDPTQPLDPNDLIGQLLEELTGGDPFGDGSDGGLFDKIMELQTKLEELQSHSTGKVELNSLSAPGTAKNVITVGASESDRPPGQGFGGLSNGAWGQALPFFAAPISEDYTSDNVNGMAPFSSRGPAADGRIKPDIVAPGTNIVSLRSTLAEAPGKNPLAGDQGNPVYWGADKNQSYAYAGGTSQAAPMVSGAAALVREYYQKQGVNEPSAALIKATLLNSAVDMAPGQYGTGEFQEMGKRPNPVEGWGRLNVRAAVHPAPPLRSQFQEALPGLATGDEGTATYRVAEAGKPLRFTLVWTDAPGSPAAARALVNDLDLSVTTPSGEVLPGNGGEDRINNVEDVEIASAAPGEYRVRVKGVNVPEGPQPYALVVTGALEAGPSVRLPGDVTGDGQVAVTDALAALRMAAGLAPQPTGDVLAAADVAPKPGTDGRAVGDGTVNVQDVLRILKHLLGLEPGVWP